MSFVGLRIQEGCQGPRPFHNTEILVNTFQVFNRDDFLLTYHDQISKFDHQFLFVVEISDVMFRNSSFWKEVIFGTVGFLLEFVSYNKDSLKAQDKLLFTKDYIKGWNYLQSNNIHFLSTSQFFCKYSCNLHLTRIQKISLLKGHTLGRAETYNGSLHEPPWTTASGIVAI